MARSAWILGGAAALSLLGTSGFILWKAERIARELVDPPFYRPRPLAQVEATFQELAQGDGTDPGGIWTPRRLGHLEVWRMTRKAKSRGLVLLLHGFGDDRWGTSPALRWFPTLDAAIFTFLGRDEAIRTGRPVPPVTFGAREHEDVIRVVHDLEMGGIPRNRIVLMGRSLGASVGLLALARLEAEGRGPLGGIIWEGAPASSRDFAERLVRGPKDRPWHFLAPLIGRWAAARAGRLGAYAPGGTDLRTRLSRPLETPGLAFLATQDRLAPAEVQRALAANFRHLRIREVPTWHLNCAERLGPAYAAEIQEACRQWLNTSEGPEGPPPTSR